MTVRLILLIIFILLDSYRFSVLKILINFIFGTLLIGPNYRCEREVTVILKPFF